MVSFNRDDDGDADDGDDVRPLRSRGEIDNRERACDDCERIGVFLREA